VILTATAGSESDVETKTDYVTVSAAVGSELVTRTIAYTYDSLYRLTKADYSTGESFAHVYDAVGNRTTMTSTTPPSGTVVTTYTYDAANRLADRTVSDGRAYSYVWSARGQLLSEWTQGYPVRTFSYDAAGRMTQATVFTLTTRFAYNGDGDRLAVEVVGHGTTMYTLDYAAGNRILAEETVTDTMLYLYGYDCLGQFADADGEWLYYLPDADGQVRQVTNEQGQVESTWLYDPDGTVLEGPEGPVSHLVCGGIYDWSTGLIFKGGRYFDPMLGLWLALGPLVVVQSWRGRKRKRRGFPWYVLALVFMSVGGTATGCQPKPVPTVCVKVPTLDHLTPKLVDKTMPPPYKEDNVWWIAFGTEAIKTTDPDNVPKDGIVFSANVVNEPNLTGNLHFKQHIKGGRVMELSDGTSKSSWLNQWHLDEDDPYGGYYPVPRPGDAAQWDNPRQKLVNPDDTSPAYPEHIHIDEEYVMFVYWGPQSYGRQDRALLGYVEWNWGADATLGADGKWTLDSPGTRDITSTVTNKNTPGKPLAIPPGHANAPPDPHTWK
jgi:YD repeat-containing protein